MTQNTYYESLQLNETKSHCAHRATTGGLITNKRLRCSTPTLDHFSIIIAHYQSTTRVDYVIIACVICCHYYNNDEHNDCE